MVDVLGSLRKGETLAVWENGAYASVTCMEGIEQGNKILQKEKVLFFGKKKKKSKDYTYDQGRKAYLSIYIIFFDGYENKEK